MTERFSPEYIDFVARPEFQALLDWEPRVGDWVYGTKHNNVGLLSYHLVQRTDLTMTPALAVDLHDGEYYVYGTAKTSRGTPVDRILQDWCWLPTLSDLLEGLEEAGYKWNLTSRLNLGAESKLIYFAAIQQPSISWDDPMPITYEDVPEAQLAAARLWVRVLEKEERDE